MLTKISLSKFVASEVERNANDESLLTGVSKDAADLINALVERILEVVYPVNSSAVYTQILKRVGMLFPMQGKNTPTWIIATMELNDHIGESTTMLSKETIKRMIRDVSGDIVFTNDTADLATEIVEIFIRTLIGAIRTSLNIVSPTLLEGKHIVDYLYNHGGLEEFGFDRSPIGPIKNSSRKKRSSSKRKCSSGKRRVKSFVRDGKRVKSYCRKK